MFSGLVFWACVLGSIVLVTGLFLIRKDLTSAPGPDKMNLLGYSFVAAPLTVFATEHMFLARSMMEMVPSWIPAKLFWTYFVGIALYAAAVSFTARKQVRWSALGLAIMFFIFVLTMDLPALFDHAKDRISWTLMLRESAFGGGALALAGATWKHDKIRISKALVAIGRTCVAVALIFYGIEHFVFAKNAPGVPLEKLTPNWVPVPQLWAYAVGVVLLVAGIAMLFNWRTRAAAASVGSVMAFLTLFLYFPLLVKAYGTPQALEELNYVGDTLLFGGTVFLVGIAAAQASNAGFKLRE
jgi:uncharacterized membrane protein